MADLGTFAIVVIGATVSGGVGLKSLTSKGSKDRVLSLLHISSQRRDNDSANKHAILGEPDGGKTRAAGEYCDEYCFENFKIYYNNDIPLSMCCTSL